MAVLSVVALVYTAAAALRGPVLTTDSLTYSRWADMLIAMRFDYVSWARSIDFAIPPLAYAGWVTLVAANKLIFGPGWATGILLVNLGLSLSVVALVLQRARATTASWLIVCFGGAAFLAAFEFFLWIPYALSDVSFAFLVCVILYIVCSDAWPARRPLVRAAIPLGLALVALFYRPAGLPVLMTVIVVSAIVARLHRAGGPARTTAARRIALGGLLLVTLAIVADSLLMSDPGRWPLPLLSSWIQGLGADYRQGVVVFGRPDTFHAPPQGFLDYVWLNVDRLRSFFTFWSADFSAGHDLANLAFFVPVYLGWIVAVASVLRGAIGASWAQWWTTIVATVFIVFVCLFHSFQQLDYDWRYRLPCLPVLVMVGAVGWHEILRGVQQRTHAARPPDARIA